MDYNRLGTILRTVRIRKGWRQQDVADRAHTTRDIVSRLERGRGRELTLADVVSIGEALEIGLKLVATWRGGDLDRLLNARHSGLHESVARWLLGDVGWQAAPEVSFSIYGERGVIDILAWHEASRTVLVVELKTEIVDVNELMGRVDVKHRLAKDIARERGWHARHVAAWVVVAEGSTNRRRVAAHATTLRAAFPAGGRAMARWMAAPSGAVRGLSFWSDAQRARTKTGFATIKRVRRPRARAA